VIEKISTLWPEIALFMTTCVVMLLGLSANLNIRKLCAPVSAAGLIIAGVLAFGTTPENLSSTLPHFAMYGKLLAAVVGLLLLGLLTGVADRQYEALVASGRERFDPIRTVRGEFYAFFLFSITGLMLCAGATNLIWLFLALELVSLPTYVMIALSSGRERAMESAVKYFFLGALGAAIFLFGFVFIYGATGSVELAEITRTFVAQGRDGGINAIGLLGVLLAILGLCFKIAAVPMHLYTPDVYQGAASPVTAMLAFVPKAAGFYSLILILACVGWGGGGGLTVTQSAAGSHGALPSPIGEVLTIIAVLTMTIGNVLAVMQSSVKRVLAYSSIAHSGYMLVALIAGPGPFGTDMPSNGFAAVMMYLLSYGITNVAVFSVLAVLERRQADGTIDEVDGFGEIRGLRKRHTGLAAIFSLGILGLMGFPPLFGFFAKLPLFQSGWAGGHMALVLILGINSAIAAYYYLRLLSAALLDSPEASARNVESFERAPLAGRDMAGYCAVLAMVGLIVLPLFQVSGLQPTRWASDAGEYKAIPGLEPSRNNATTLAPAPQPVPAPEARADSPQAAR
jgi:NADH-quinone oxidoreductase subunit N